MIIRVNIKGILADEVQRKALMVAACVALQAREGIDTTVEQMAQTYDKIRNERK